jgi:hypothetical protein
VGGPQTPPLCRVDRAALAFSVLPPHGADVVHERLNGAERSVLRAALSRNRDASDAERQAALLSLLSAVRTGLVFPRPTGHDEASCPFQFLATHKRECVVEVFERLARRDPFEVAVALCHLSPIDRDDLWNRLQSETRSKFIPLLERVHGAGVHQTREYARDLRIRLSAQRRPPLAARQAPRSSIATAC